MECSSTYSYRLCQLASEVHIISATTISQLKADQDISMFWYHVIEHNLITLPTVILVEAATGPLVTMYVEAELVLDVQ